MIYLPVAMSSKLKTKTEGLHEGPAPGSRSSTRAPTTSTLIESAPRTTSLACCAPRPDAPPYDRDLSDLVGELSTQSNEFRTRWAAHNVRFHITGIKHFHHPVVGDLSLTYDRIELPADPGLTIFKYTAEPGSRSEEALNLLGSWAAALDQAETAHAADNT